MQAEAAAAEEAEEAEEAAAAAAAEEARARAQRNNTAGSLQQLLLPAFHNLYTTNVLAVSAVLLTSAWHKGLASGVSDPVNAAFFGGGSNMPSIVRLHLSEALAHLASMPPHVHALGPALAVTLAYNTCHGPGVTPTALLDLVGHLATHIPLEALVVAGLVTHGAWIHAAGTTIGLLHSAVWWLSRASYEPACRDAWSASTVSDLLHSAHALGQPLPAPSPPHPLPATGHQLVGSMLRTRAGFSALASMLHDGPEPAMCHIRDSLPPSVAKQVNDLFSSSLLGCTSSCTPMRPTCCPRRCTCWPPPTTPAPSPP